MARNSKELSPIKDMTKSRMDETTTKKSNLFHAFLKYVLPKATSFSEASTMKIAVKI